MPTFIIHKDGAYNLFSTVVDACHYESALTLDQLREVLPGDIDSRLARAHATGCSGIDWTLQDCIHGNRAGPGEKEMPADEFLRRYLTLPSSASGAEAPDMAALSRELADVLRTLLAENFRGSTVADRLQFSPVGRELLRRADAALAQAPA